MSGTGGAGQGGGSNASREKDRGQPETWMANSLEETSDVS